MQYELATWRVKNLLLVPSFAFPPSAIINRKPLSPTARRAGWVGCNFALNRVPADARIAVVTTFASPRRSGVAPDSDYKTSALRAGFPGPDQNTKFQDGDRRDACPTETVIVPPEEVREKFKRIKPLKDISVTQRGWTLDVLNIVRRIVSVSATLRRDESEGRAPRDPNFSVSQGRWGVVELRPPTVLPPPTPTPSPANWKNFILIIVMSAITP